MAVQTSVRLDDELESDLQTYIDSHEYPPDKSDVIRRALREFLDHHLDD